MECHSIHALCDLQISISVFWLMVFLLKTLKMISLSNIDKEESNIAW